MRPPPPAVRVSFGHDQLCRVLRISGLHLPQLGALRARAASVPQSGQPRGGRSRQTVQGQPQDLVLTVENPWMNIDAADIISGEGIHDTIVQFATTAKISIDIVFYTFDCAPLQQLLLVRATLAQRFNKQVMPLIKVRLLLDWNQLYGRPVRAGRAAD